MATLGLILNGALDFVNGLRALVKEVGPFVEVQQQSLCQTAVSGCNIDSSSICVSFNGLDELLENGYL